MCNCPVRIVYVDRISFESVSVGLYECGCRVL